MLENGNSKLYKIKDKKKHKKNIIVVKTYKNILERKIK